MKRFLIGKEWKLRMNGNGGQWEPFVCVKAKTLADAVLIATENQARWIGDTHRYQSASQPCCYYTVQQIKG